MKKAFSRTLYELANQVLRQLKESRDKKEMVPVKYPYLQAKISDFKYEKGSQSYTTSFEPFFNERWDDRKRFDFANKIKQIEEYKEAVKTIAENYNQSEAQSGFWLDRFVHRIMDESLHDIDEKDIVELVTLFISDLEHTPIQWNPIVWLDGIQMETDLVEINKYLKIKRPEPSDLEYEIRYDITPIMRPDLGPGVPSAIMLFHHRAKDQLEMHYKIETIISTLKLFRVGSVLAQRIQWNPVSMLALGGTGQNLKQSTPFKYELNKDNGQKLRDFFKIMEPMIFDRIIQKKNKEENFITIAFTRYNNALEESMPESRLTYGTMCLEALYLRDERQELARKLSQRVASALSFFGYNPLKVYNDVKSSYNIRSIFVHGSKIEREKRSDLARLEKEMMDYARISLIIFLQLQDNLEKNDLLTKLDNSLLDSKTKDRLTEILKKNCQIM